MPKIITHGATLHCTLDGWTRGLSLLWFSPYFWFQRF